MDRAVDLADSFLSVDDLVNLVRTGPGCSLSVAALPGLSRRMAKIVDFESALLTVLREIEPLAKELKSRSSNGPSNFVADCQVNMMFLAKADPEDFRRSTRPC
jgi:hypothetical protein